jgi:hypothetical protein
MFKCSHCKKDFKKVWIIGDKDLCENCRSLYTKPKKKNKKTDSAKDKIDKLRGKTKNII